MSELYELPNGWEWNKLEKLTKLQNGFAFKSNLFVDSGLPIVRIKNIKNEKVLLDDVVYFKMENYGKKLDTYQIKRNDILIAMSGATTGKIGLYESDEIAYLNQRVGLFRIDNSDLRSYLFYFLSTQIEKNLEQSLGAAQPNLSTQQINDIEIPLPPLSEQQRIVSKLDKLFKKIDKAIALHQKNMDEAKVFMGSVLNDVFGELEEQKHQMLRFDTYTKLSRGHNPPKKDFIYKEKEGYVRFIQIRDGSSDNNTVYVPFTKKLHLVTTQDLLLVAYRQIGKVFRNMEGAFNVALCKIENNDYSNLDTNYLYYLIQSKYVKDELLSRSERALIPSMSVDHLKSIVIPTPPLQIQQKVVKYLDEISEKIEKVKSKKKEKMDSLKALKASILDKAFRGEL